LTELRTFIPLGCSIHAGLLDRLEGAFGRERLSDCNCGRRDAGVDVLNALRLGCVLARCRLVLIAGRQDGAGQISDDADCLVSIAIVLEDIAAVY